MTNQTQDTTTKTTQPNERLRMERITAQINAKEFAASLGIPQSTYCGLESLKGRLENASCKTVVKICQALNIRVEWLLRGEEPKHPSAVGIDVNALEQVLLTIRTFEDIDNSRIPTEKFVQKTIAAYMQFTMPKNYT